jgi:hypothetical protein
MLSTNQDDVDEKLKRMNEMFMRSLEGVGRGGGSLRRRDKEKGKEKREKRWTRQECRYNRKILERIRDERAASQLAKLCSIINRTVTSSFHTSSLNSSSSTSSFPTILHPGPLLRQRS